MQFFHTSVSSDAGRFLADPLTSTMLSEGKRVAEFEAALAAQIGLSHPVAVNSGTAALHLGLVCGGIGPGDEVILPAQTFIASGLSVLMAGGTAVFADINVRTGNISVASIAERITKRTKAIMPVHWGGYPCDMDEIGALAQEHGLWVIEDAAHALGAVYQGRPVGTLSRFTAFSFQAIKHLTTGDGGALCCLDERDWARARARRWFGIDRASSKPSELGEREYDVAELGFKYHMNDLAAALGLANLADFHANLQRRRAIADRYRQELAGVPGLDLLESRGDRESAWWLFTMLVERRLDFVRRLKGAGVPTSVVHLGIARNTVFGNGTMRDLPSQREFDARQIAIPLHPGLTDDDVDLVIRTIRSGW